MIGIMEKGKKIPPQEASQTNPVAKPEDTKGGINNMVSSGVVGKKLAEQAEENEEMPMHHLIADKDYPSGIREWMITSPSDLKYPTLVVAAAMLSVYLTRVRIQYVYDNQGEKSAIVLQVIVEGEQSSGKSFARYIMRTLMKPFIERDSEMRAKEQEYAALKRRQGKKDGKLPPEPKTDITILPETVSLTMFIKRCDAAVKLYGAPKTLFEFADEISAIVHSAKRQFADLSQVIKTAYDLGSVYGQDFMSESSYSAMVDALLSFVFCGTQSAVSRYMNKAAIEGGAVTRTILCPLISHLGDNPPQFQALTDTQRNELENTLDKLFGLCYEEDGKFHQEIEEDMSWLYKTVVKWCNDCRQQVVKTMSKSMVYGMQILPQVTEKEPLVITEGCTDCWSAMSMGYKAIAIPSATLCNEECRNLLAGRNLHMWPDQDKPGLGLYMKLKEMFPQLVYHQLPEGCKDLSDYYQSFYVQKM